MAGFFLNRRLAQPAPVFFSWSMLPGSVTAEILARTQFEACLIDLQHGLIGFSDFVPMMTAMHKAGSPVLARPALGDTGMTGKLLDAGAAGVIVPMINTGEDARALVQATKYPPLGERSWGASLAVAAAGLAKDDYLHQANALFMTFGMIETGEALENLDDICAVEGMDGVFVGPHDLSISLTGGKAADATRREVQAALPRVVAAANNAGIVPGIYAATPELARQFAGLGFRLIAVGSDINFLSAGAGAAFDTLKSI